jgi:very-short-patch-repair endonuclease
MAIIWPDSRHSVTKVSLSVRLRTLTAWVSHSCGEVDMGWGELKIAVEYEGDHHRTNRKVFNRDIRRNEAFIEQGWIVIRVTSMDTEGGIIRRIEAALTARGASW